MPTQQVTTPTDPAEPPAQPQRTARRLLALGATTAVLGIALSLGGESGLAGLVCVGGVALLLTGLHRLGRLGPA